MNITGVVVGILVTLVFSGVCGYFVFDEKIKIERKIKPYSWMIIHVSVCAVTLWLMVNSDYFYLILKEPDITTPIIRFLYIFIQNGGLMIFVMLLSVLLYDTLVKACHYQYFVKRHTILKKLFFSLVCMSMIILYVIEFDILNNGVKVLAGEYNFIITWIIVLVEIWVGFGMQIYGKKELEKVKDQVFAELKNREERRNIIWCLATMIVSIVFIFCWYFVRKFFPEIVQSFFIDLMRSMAIGVAAVIFVMFLWKRRYRPNSTNSKKRLKKLLDNIDVKNGIEYYQDVKYELERRDENILLKIYGKEIELVEEGNYSDKFIDELKCAFKKKEIIVDKICVDEIEKELHRTAKERKELLEQAWEVAYNVCDEKEKERSVSYITRRLQ